MGELSAQALDAVPWEQLESADPDVPVKEVRRVLRRLFRDGPASTEEYCYPLFTALRLPTHGVPSVAPAVLPFVVALAADPLTGARTTLVELLAYLSEAAAQAPRHLVAGGWTEAWGQAQGTIQALLVDPDPAVRREALPLADGPGTLLERWRSEHDLSVRLPVLFTLGGLATGSEATAEIRAVLDDLLRDDDPVLRVAAVHATADANPEVPVREQEMLVAALVDPTARSRWEAVWYMPDVEYPYSREDVAFWTAGLFEDVPAMATAFLTRLAAAADPVGDPDLSRAVLDQAWRLLTCRRSVEPALLPLADGLLDHPDPSVRYRAAHLLAALGPRAAACADRLAALLDDSGEAEFREGTVAEHARWALARMGDARALPGLVDRLCAPYREQCGRSYVMGDPRRPEIADVLGPLRAQADALVPQVREELRRELSDPEGSSYLTADLLAVLKAWGTDALPALPEVTACLADRFRWGATAEALAAMGPAASSAAPAVRERMTLEPPGNHIWLRWVLWRIGGVDRAEALRAVGEALPVEGQPPHGPVGRLADFGTDAAPYADRVRYVLEHSEGWGRVQAAAALWSITGDPDPGRSILEEQILALASGGDDYGLFQTALQTLVRFGALTPTAKAALQDLRYQDRRISAYGDYRAILQDEEFRALIDEALS